MAAPATAAHGVGTLTREVQLALRRNATEVPSIDEQKHAHEWEAACEAARSAKAALECCTRMSSSGGSLRTSLFARVASGAALADGWATGRSQQPQGDAAAHSGTAQTPSERQARSSSPPRLGRKRSGTESRFIGAHKANASPGTSGSASPMRRVSLSASLPTLPNIDAASLCTREPRRPAYSATVQRDGSARVVLNPRASTVAEPPLLPLQLSASQPLLKKRATDPRLGSPPRVDHGRSIAACSQAAARPLIPGEARVHAGLPDIAGRPPVPAGASPPRRAQRGSADWRGELIRAIDGAEAALTSKLRASSPDANAVRQRLRVAFDGAAPPALDRRDSQRRNVPAPAEPDPKPGASSKVASGSAEGGEGIRPQPGSVSAPAGANSRLGSKQSGGAGVGEGSGGGPSKQADVRAAPTHARLRKAAWRRQVISLFELHRQALDRSMSMAVLRPAAVESSHTFLDFGRVLELHFPRATRRERAQMLRVVAAHEEATSRSRRRAQVRLRPPPRSQPHWAGYLY
jgi:hypothetical protein